MGNVPDVLLLKSPLPRESLRVVTKKANENGNVSDLMMLLFLVSNTLKINRKL